METLDSDARIPNFKKTFHSTFLFAACPEHETEKRSGQQVDVRTIGDNPVLADVLQKAFAMRGIPDTKGRQLSKRILNATSTALFREYAPTHRAG